MKVVRDIQRRVTISADEVYQALVKTYDFPSLGENNDVHFDMGGTSICHEVTLVAIDRTEQEKA